MSRVLAGRKNPCRRTTSAAEMADFRLTFYMEWIASKSSAVTKTRHCLRDPRPYLAYLVDNKRQLADCQASRAIGTGTDWQYTYPVVLIGQ